MRYACCDISFRTGRNHCTIKVLAVFQHRKDAEAFCMNVPSLGNKRAFVADVLTGELMGRKSYTVRDFMNMGLSNEDAHRMYILEEARRKDVLEFFKNWRKQNGIMDKKEKSA